MTNFMILEKKHPLVIFGQGMLNFHENKRKTQD